MTFDALHDACGPSSDAERATPSGRLSWEDPLLYLLGLVVGVVPVVAVLVRGGSWGAEPSVGLVFCIFSAVALTRHVCGTHVAAERQHRARKGPGF